MYSDTAVYPTYSKVSAKSGSLSRVVFVCICRVMAIQVTLAYENGRGGYLCQLTAGFVDYAEPAYSVNHEFWNMVVVLKRMICSMVVLSCDS